MYTVHDYGGMIADGVRVRAYEEALGAVVRTGSTVLDLGAGTGLFALIACRLGASRVYAVEPSEVVQIGREVAASNGLEDRIRFIRGSSLDVTLPERVDVVVADLRGVLPLHGRLLSILHDARTRHLKPGGVLVPARDTLKIAAVEDASAHEGIRGPWQTRPGGADLSAALPYAVNLWRKAGGGPRRLLTDPATWAVLDYAAGPDPDVSGGVDAAVIEAGTAHGMLGWFECDLVDGVRFATGPDGPETVYGRAFFPFPEAVSIQQGDRLEVRIFADLVGEDYVWRWDTRIEGSGGQERVRFRQSTFAAVPLSSERLRRREGAFHPALAVEGRIDSAILEMMDGTHDLLEIAGRVAERFPEAFSSPERALDRVASLSDRYSGEESS